MKFAILGGSFDPIHNGHLNLAESALAFGYDRVIFVPAYRSPFKPSEQSGSAEQRVGMILAAIQGRRDMTVDICEIRREGVSYTIDTLRDIIARYLPEGKPGLILGDDLLARYAEWQGADEIARRADILIGRRESSSIDFPFPHKALANNVIALSSAEIRTFIAADGGWRASVPSVVRDHIETRGLYGAPRREEAPAAIPQTSLIEFEGYVRRRLTFCRFIHSRNVALHCADLAARFGVDVDAAYMAGLAHDLCKDLDNAALQALAGRDGRPFSAEEEAKPGLLHGRAAAVFLREDIGIHDRAILDAVRDHTTGTEDAAPLSMILYLTDKIEMGRVTVDPLLRKMVFDSTSDRSLASLYETVMRATRQWLRERGVIRAEGV